MTVPAAAAEPDAVAGQATAQAADVVTLMAARPELKTFVALLRQARLDTWLAGRPAVTVFAPTDEAFRDMSSSALDRLTRPEALKALLLFHISGSVYASDELQTGMLPTFTEDEITVRVSRQRYAIRLRDAVIVEPDLIAGNGRVHVINKVMTPPPPPWR